MIISLDEMKSYLRVDHDDDDVLLESQTNEDEIEVQTETLSLKATPLANGVVKSKTGDDTTDAAYRY